MQFNYIDETSYEVTFRGLQTQLDEVTIDRISPNINVDNLTEGIHDVELNFFVPSNVELVSERPTIAIELSQSVEEELNPDDQ